MRSRSPVVTPGRTSETRMSRHAASAAPAAAIASTSSGVLGTGPEGSCGLARLGERRCDACMDLIRRAGAIDLLQNAAGPVVLGQRTGVALVDVQPVGDRLWPIVVALVELALPVPGRA